MTEIFNLVFILFYVLAKIIFHRFLLCGNYAIFFANFGLMKGFHLIPNQVYSRQAESLEATLTACCTNHKKIDNRI